MRRLRHLHDLMKPKGSDYPAKDAPMRKDEKVLVMFDELKTLLDPTLPVPPAKSEYSQVKSNSFFTILRQD